MGRRIEFVSPLPKSDPSSSAYYSSCVTSVNGFTSQLFSSPHLCTGKSCSCYCLLRAIVRIDKTLRMKEEC